MKNGFFFTISLVIIFSATPYASYAAEISGQTTAKRKLQKDIAKVLAANTRGFHGCKKIDLITVAQIRVNPPGTGDSVASRQYGSVEERWTVSACGNSTPYLVTLTPDGEGGTFFRTVEDRQSAP